jgi:hypothetical protein
VIGTYKEKDKSSYTPRKEIKALTKNVQADFQVGWDIQHQSWREFNNMNVIDRLNKDQDDFNILEDAPSKDPDKAWRSTSVTPMSRNKVISIAAHIMVSLMFPNVNGRNEDGEPEQDAADVIRKMVLWNIDNSDYDMSMLFGVIASLNSPCAYLGVPYYEATQKIREELENGDINIKDATDDILSGIHFDNIPVDEMLISNIRQRDHQMQRFTIRVENIDYTTAEALYGEHQDFRFVDPGIKRVFDSKSGLFYDSDDTQNPTAVQKVTYRNRTEDLEVTYINGVYLGDEDNVENNPMVHRNCDNRPRYAEAKFGYEPISERFYYYKSAINKLSGEKGRIDRMHRFIEDGTYLEIIKPIFTTGGVEVNASVVFPGAVTDFPKDTQITPYSTGANLNAGYQFVQAMESRASESTQSAQQGGAVQKGVDTAYEASRLEYNAVIKEFGIFGRMVGNAVEKVGELLVDNILWHQTIGEMDEMAGPGLRMKFRTYLLSNQSEKGRKVNEKIVFSDEYMGRDMSEQEIKDESYKLLRKGGVKESMDDLHTKIYVANPYMIRKFKYTLDVEPDQLIPRSMMSEENRKLKAYSLMIADPNADQRAVSRDFLFEVFAKGKSDEYMSKADKLGITPAMPGDKPAAPGADTSVPTPDQFLPANNVPSKMPMVQ